MFVALEVQERGTELVLGRNFTSRHGFLHLFVKILVHLFIYVCVELDAQEMEVVLRRKPGASRQRPC